MRRAIVVGMVLACSRMVQGQAAGQSDTLGDPVAIAEREVARGWSARTVRSGDAVVFPFGRTQPTVTCAPLRACVIQLETGERVLGTASGDGERWLVDRTVTGEGGRTVLVVVKPIACNLTTNLVLSTDRRVYDITLFSPPCVSGRAGGADNEYARHVSFYYPDALLARSKGDSDQFDSCVGSRPEALNFGYHWTSNRRIPWNPVAVYDDGVHVYVKLPASATHEELPALFLEGLDGKLAVLNYAVRGGDTFVSDRVFDRAVLIVGPNGKDGRVEIVNDRAVQKR